MTAKRRVGFISTRFSGTDGVSLEAAKWAEVLRRMGHQCYYFCGESDRPAEVTSVVPEAYFQHEAIRAIHETVFFGDWEDYHARRSLHPEMQDLHRDFFSLFIRPEHVSARVQELKQHLKEELYGFALRFRPEVLIVENALSIPTNLPLGLAVTEFVAETGFPVIAHHHDFAWERQRFHNNSVQDYLAAAFPPRLPSIRHVVINSLQARQLALRIGVAAMVLPNVMDFEQPAPPPDDYAASARGDIGVQDGEYLILQPTRIVRRKGIEHAIELTRRLGLPARLVISHAGGDEHSDYEERVREFAALLGVSVNFESDLVGPQRATTRDGRRVYSLADLYPKADLVTYPSTMEGFGNAFLEAIYFRRPLVINNYSIFEADIKPKGFRVVEFNGYITDATLEHARRLLQHPEVAAEYAEQNFALARRHYSYAVLERRLGLLLADCFGEAA